MPLLTADEFKATMASPMRRVEPTDDLPRITLAPYVDTIPVGDLQGKDFAGRSVQHVYATPDGRFVHVLIAASTPDGFLVVVIDAEEERMLGHHLLDLPHAYGFDE